MDLLQQNQDVGHLTNWLVFLRSSFCASASRFRKDKRHEACDQAHGCEYQSRSTADHETQDSTDQ